MLNFTEEELELILEALETLDGQGFYLTSPEQRTLHSVQSKVEGELQGG